MRRSQYLSVCFRRRGKEGQSARSLMARQAHRASAPCPTSPSLCVWHVHRSACCSTKERGSAEGGDEPRRTQHALPVGLEVLDALDRLVVLCNLSCGSESARSCARETLGTRQKDEAREDAPAEPASSRGQTCAQPCRRPPRRPWSRPVGREIAQDRSAERASLDEGGERRVRTLDQVTSRTGPSCE